MDGDVHANTHRMAARGNATSFPLPWEDLLVQFQNTDRCARVGVGIPLPRAGVELANVVSMLLKTAGGDQDEQVSARFVHQANVRRHVVIALIEELKRRGHSAYAHVDLEDVKKRAQALPENDIPPEIVRLLPLDNAHDKVQPNKNATPVRRGGSLEQVQNNLSVLRMNAVVSENSTFDEGDEPAQARACVDNTARKLKRDVARGETTSEDEDIIGASADAASSRTDNVVVERVGVKTGNAMIDQYEPYYWGCAFAFLFSRIIVGILTCQHLLIRPGLDDLQMRLV